MCVLIIMFIRAPDDFALALYHVFYERILPFNLPDIKESGRIMQLDFKPGENLPANRTFERFQTFQRFSPGGRGFLPGQFF